MANYRHLLIQLVRPGGFDGTTFGPPPNKGVAGGTPGAYEPTDAPQTSRYLRLETEDNVGRLTPQMLGRDGKTIGFIRCYSDGPISEGDQYFGIGSNVTTEADPTDAARTPVIPLDTRLDRAPPIELGPTDDLILEMTIDGEASIHVVILDLTDEMLFDRSESVADDVLPPTDIEVRTMAAGQILPWTGTLYLRLDANPGATFLLPAEADMVDASRLFVVRVGNADGAVRIFPQAGESYNNQVDGFFELAGCEGSIVDFINGEFLGLKPSIRNLVTVTNAAIDGEQQLPPLPSPSLHAQADYSARGSLRLPFLAETPLDGVYLITRADTVNREQVILRPKLGERLAGEVDGVAYLPINGVLVVYRGVGGWVVVSDNIVRPEPLLTVAADTVLTAFGFGERIVRVLAAISRTVTLPSRALVPTGARLRLVALGTAASHTVAAAAGDTITGLGAVGAVNSVINQGFVRLLVAGDANEWLIT